MYGNFFICIVSSDVDWQGILSLFKFEGLLLVQTHLYPRYTNICLSVCLAGFKPSGGALQCLRVWRDSRSTVPWWGHPLGPVPALTAVSRHLEQPEKGRQQQMVEWAAKGGRVRVRVGGEWVSPFSCFSNNTYAGKPDASRTLSLALCCLWLLHNDCLFSLLLQNISTLYFGYFQSRLVVI